MPATLVLAAILALIGASSGWRFSEKTKRHYQIQPESKLYLKGTTNVNCFTCNCTDQFPAKYLDVESQGGYARFQNADLKINTQNFNCHNRKIEADMEKALQADVYPYIGIELEETWQNAQCLASDSKDWFPVKAKIRLTITKVTKDQIVLAKARRISPGRFQLLGEKALQMSEYGIEPPEAMFGMIKVNDWITFHFDLTVQVDENTQ